MKQISKYFINGLLLIVPIAITFIVIDYSFVLTDNLLGQYLPIKIPGLSMVVFLAMIVAVGWLSSLWLLKSLVKYVDTLIGSIPVVKFIYTNVKQFSQAFFESKKLLNQPVLVPFPHPNAKALGFVVEDLSPPLAAKFAEEHVCVFIPMSLNLTAGFNIFVPLRDIIPVDITSESALQYVITAGVVMPKERGENGTAN
jgi:uncharacterized membrane protein